MMPADERDRQLQALWSRRDNLNNPEWVQLWELVYQILRSKHFTEHQSLPEDPDIYIHDFFTRKVLEPARREGYDANSKIHAGALCLYYRRFLIGVIRGIDQSLLSFDDEEVIQVLEKITGTEPSPAAVQLLEEAGLTLEQVGKAAKVFMEEQEEWARLYLKCHACAERGTKKPLSYFANRVPAYNYKARKLGIIPGGRQFPDYRMTLLGDWLTSLGLKLDPDYQEVIEVALTILCREALLYTGTNCEEGNEHSAPSKDAG